MNKIIKVHYAIMVALLLVGPEVPAQSASGSGAIASHFKPAPSMEGALNENTERISGWLKDGFSNILATMTRLADDKALNAETIVSFRQRLKQDESIGAPVEAAITNAQAVVASLEKLMLNPRLNIETRRQTEVNISNANQQINLLLLNQQKVAIARNQLAELGKACEYWEQFWVVTVRAIGEVETRRQLKGLIEQERARLQAWMTSEKGLGR